MRTMRFRTHLGADGVLRLELALDMSDTELEVLVVVQPIEAQEALSAIGDQLVWPPGFFEQTYGCLSDEPLVREFEGAYEERDALR